MTTFKALTIILLLNSMMISVSFASQNIEIKKVECSVEIMPNYIWHLFALSNLWDKDKSVYYEKFGTTVPKTDLDYMHEKRNLIAWGNGTTPALAHLLFFIPFTGNMSDKDYFDYLEAIDKANKDSNWLDFAKKYCPQYISMADNMKGSREDIEMFDKLKIIITNNYPLYRDKVWGEVKKILDQEKWKIDSVFRDNNIIELWENALKMKYIGKDLTPVLTYANSIDNLPSANNLSDSRNNFGVSEIDTERNIDKIIHEIGIYTFMPIIQSLYDDPKLQTDFNKKNNLIYQSFESFIEKKKGDITGKLDIWNGALYSGGTFNFPFFIKYYTENEDKYSTVQLIHMAINEYNKEYNK